MQIFALRAPLRRFLLAGLELLLIAAIFIAAAYPTYDVTLPVYLLYDGGLVRILLGSASFLLGLYVVRLYSDLRVRFRTGLAFQLVQALGIVFLIQALLSYSWPDLKLPIGLMITAGPIVVLVLFFWRVIFNIALLRALPMDRVLLLGSSNLLQEIGWAIESRPSLGMVVAGYVDDAQAPGARMRAGEVLGPLAALHEICERVRPNRIMADRSLRGSAEWALLELQTSGITVEDAVSIHEAIFGRISIRNQGSTHMFFGREFGPGPGSIALQSIYSNLVALLGAFVLVPLILLIALLIRIMSGGPALVSHPHLGWHGLPFNLYRFRCTTASGEVTRIGRFLRKYHLEGLPQWLNILRGEMTVVGPRPERQEFAPILAGLVPLFNQRYLVKPGLVGWSQLKCDLPQGSVDSLARLEYDLYYLKHISLALDAYIFLTTLRHFIGLEEAPGPLPQTV